MEFKKNDMVTVKIEDMSHDGSGIGKADGYTLFIKDAVIGDEVEAKIMKTKKNYGFAKGFQMVTVSELAAAKGISLGDGIAYGAIR